jgi:hypothetical protein
MSIETLTATILSKMSGVGKWQSEFFTHAVRLFLSLRGRYNFWNMARYGGRVESTYRQNFQKPFDFATFNAELIKWLGIGECVWAFDPSYISKSGKHTQGAGYFWSGCAGAMKWGLEIAGLAMVSVRDNTALHYFAQQTQALKAGQSLLSYYSEVLAGQAEQMRGFSNLLAVDAFFSKKPFIDAMIEANLHVISRLRDDAVLFYPYLGPRSGGKGRPKEYAGRVDVRKPDPQYFTPCLQEEDEIAYEGRVYCKALRRWVRAVLVHTLRNGEAKTVKIFFSTLVNLPGADILLYYRQRYQIEFLFRDSKGFAGLEHCQARSQEKLEYHFNLSLTSVNIAKALHWFSLPQEQRGAFSMADIKTQYFNELMLEKFICLFGCDPKVIKNHPAIETYFALGKIAA